MLLRTISFTTRTTAVVKNGMRRNLATPAAGGAGAGGKDAKQSSGPVGIPQPPKDQVRQRADDVRDYKHKLTELRRDLVEQGFPKQSATSLRQARIDEGKLKVGRKYTPEEKEERKKKGLEKHNAHIQAIKLEYVKRERARILKQSIRRAKGDVYRQELLEKATVQLAADIEKTWNKSIKEDLRKLVPVNAPYLGVLPKHHAEIASAFGDEEDKIQYIYGPPKPVLDEDSQYFGYDPRVVEYTEEQKSANWWASHSDTYRSYKKPRGTRPVSQGAPPPSTSAEDSKPVDPVNKTST